MAPRLRALDQGSITLVASAAARSVFWELEPDIAARVVARGEERFEKEAWLSTMLVDAPTCGFNIMAPPARRAVATVLFCGPADAPGARQLPSGPVSADAYLLSSLFVAPGFGDIGLQAVLIDAVIAELVERRSPAVEAFGVVPGRSDAEGIAARAAEIGLIDAPVLHAAGFELVSAHPVLPRYRLELPPERELLTGAAMESLLVAAAG
ncbi:hypothetical protein ACUY3K_07985 [Corynebacterium uberis]|uniref:hypothetical protein n=1 Tax=Corynebacterium TaxID=1716 RepID=UPI001D0AA187|nr:MULTISPECIES: hypothetical protein [Corynebacterium]MCZ9310159.1 hypothetical protein [Corynebacterium sp. c6VSa_13]UDL73299.1 hypothetical protein LH391_09425 [Corynebacterium uberis]UDL75823.1 hypothetical protein LH393_11505 [Corynebacterium uberis]UDL78036.1 hypothetical protein LH394_11495 [Corynebacterium uberis]UDL80318.1 hypothetical protein LH392_00390 [Corynebacterium uberis]